MVDFGRLLQQKKDREMAAEIIVGEIAEELGDQIAWWNEDLDKKFREKYITKICRMP